MYEYGFGIRCGLIGYYLSSPTFYLLRSRMVASLPFKVNDGKESNSFCGAMISPYCLYNSCLYICFFRIKK